MARCSSQLGKGIARATRPWPTCAPAFAGARRRGQGARGKSHEGEKTLLDVLVPVLAALRAGGHPGCTRLPAVADAAAAATWPIRATAGRAVVPRRAQRRACRPGRPIEPLLIARRAALRGAGMSNVGIVIVSHSSKVAEGAADMVRQMVGAEVTLAWCGGNARWRARHRWCKKILARHRSGVVEARRCDPGRSGRGGNQQRDGSRDAARRAARAVVVCNAPHLSRARSVRGDRGSGGSPLAVVRATAEELSPMTRTLTPRRMSRRNRPGAVVLSARAGCTRARRSS